MLRVLLITLIITLWATPTLAAPKLFGTSERKSSRLKSFPKWTQMLDKHQRGAHTTSHTCGGLNEGECRIANWNAFLGSLSNRPALEKIVRVNDYMNHYKYIIDPINWGMPDYWATPFQFFGKNGDCEDYAISKYLSLRAMGFSADNLRIVVLEDKNLQIMHAVLAVYVGEDVYILDNQIKSVVKHNAIHHYKPIYSINEDAYWRHR